MRYTNSKEDTHSNSKIYRKISSKQKMTSFDNTKSALEKWDKIKKYNFSIPKN